MHFYPQQILERADKILIWRPLYFTMYNVSSPQRKHTVQEPTYDWCPVGFQL